MPTPRPERSVTVSAVEKPGREMMRSSSLSLRSVLDGSTSPSRRAPPSPHLAVAPAAVCGHADGDGGAVAQRAEREAAGRRLPLGAADIGLLDAIIHRIPQQM